MSSTPPHLPTYNVRLSPDKVTTIVKHVFPNHKVSHIEQLESGKSFNNRIYFIDTAPPQHHSTQDGSSKRLVLKLAGHFFDHRKIENELGCLLLLRKHCPGLPVPKALAWSAVGGKIETVDGRQIDAPLDEPFSNRPWILTSRLPGRVLTVAGMDSDQGVGILRQLAEYVTMWRTQTPASKVWGNLRIQKTDEDTESATVFSNLIPGKVFVVDAFLLHTFPWPNTGSYYPTRAQDQLHRVQKEPQFQWTNDSFSTDWSRWIKNELPHYPICQQHTFGITHFDFSPRNILVSDSDDTGHLKVTGILDFEFTGFFPPWEEFLNAMVRQGDDWEDRHWQVIMQEMARLGQMVPPTPGVAREMCFDEEEWWQACEIVRMIDRLAPWEIMDGKYGPEELRRQLEGAGEVVNEGLERIRVAREM